MTTIYYPCTSNEAIEYYRDLFSAQVQNITHFQYLPLDFGMDFENNERVTSVLNSLAYGSEKLDPQAS